MLKAGAPFKCTHCGATLTWRDTPVIECEYCHTKILMRNIGTQTGMRVDPGAAGGAGRAKKPNMAVLVIGAAMVVGIGLIVVKASRGSSSTGSGATTARSVSKTPEAKVAPVQPAAEAAEAAENAESAGKPAAPPSIGKVVLTVGEAGTNAGQLDGARALAVTPSGAIVVAEARSGRVHVFDGQGAYQRVVTLPPSALTKELTVFGASATPDDKVVVSRAGDLLVLDVAAGKVERTIKGSYPDVFYHGDVEVVPDGSIWAVTDRTGDLSVLRVSAAGTAAGTAAGKVAWKVVAKVTRAGQHVAVDGVGTMYLSKGSVVEVRDAKGEVQRKFSQAGSGTLSHTGPIATDGKGHVFVADGSRVLVFTPDGGYIAELEVGDVEDLAIDRSGALYVLARDHVSKYELTLPAAK